MADQNRQEDMKEKLPYYSGNEIKEMEVRSLSETIISKPPHKEGLTTFAEYLGKMEEISKFRIEESLWENEIKIDIKTPYKWFGLRPIGDTHIGSEGLDYVGLKDFLAGLLRIDNLKTIGIGDLGDFFVPRGKHAEGMMKDVVNPQTQIVALRKFFTEYQDEFLGMTNDPSHCFVGEQFVVMLNGVKRIKDIKVGDKVLGFNGQTQKVLKNYKETANTIFNVKVSKLPWSKVSSEHPFYVVSLKRGRKITRKKATFRTIEDIYNDNSKDHYLVVPKTKQKKKDIFLDFTKFNTHTKDNRGNNKWLVDKIKLNKELSYFFGWYLAEGCASSKRGIRLTLSLKEKRYIDKLAEIGKKYFKVEPKVEKRKSTYCLSFNSIILSRAFENWFGTGARQKKIPFFMFQAKKEFVDKFIVGFFLGDGCVSKRKHISAITSSETVAYGFVVLSMGINEIYFAVSKQNREGWVRIFRKKCYQNNAWLIESTNNQLLKLFGIEKNRKKQNHIEDKDCFYLKISKIEKKNEKNNIYNLTTEDGTFLIPYIVHNTDWVYQTSGIDVYEYLCRYLKIPLVTQGGSVKINFGNVEYDVMPFHNIAKFKSSFNLTHAHKRALELHRDADVVIAGHIHKGAFEKAYRNGHEVACVQCGTFDTNETGSAWAKKQGFLGGVRPYYPIILFNTVEKRIQILDDLSDAEDLLDIKK